MNKNDSIITYIDYGYIKYDIKTIMSKKNLKKNQLVKKTGLHHQVVERYMTDSVTRFDRDILAKLCYKTKRQIILSFFYTIIYFFFTFFIIFYKYFKIFKNSQ